MHNDLLGNHITISKKLKPVKIKIKKFYVSYLRFGSFFYLFFITNFFIFFTNYFFCLLRSRLGSASFCSIMSRSGLFFLMLRYFFSIFFTNDFLLFFSSFLGPHR